MNGPNLQESIRALTVAVIDLVDHGRKDGSLVPMQQAYFRWRLQHELTYSEQGVRVPPAHGEMMTRPSWAMAVATVAQGKALQTKEYQAAVSNLRSNEAVAQDADQLLQQFVFRVARKAFESDPLPPPVEFDALLLRFLDDMAGAPFEGGGEVKLEGVSLENERVDPFPGITIRRPKRDDFEEEYPYYGPGAGLDDSIHGTMSAVARVVAKCSTSRDAQMAVEKFIAILRLFKVMSAKYISYQLIGDSVIHPIGGRLTAGTREVVRERGVIRVIDEARLLSFWQVIDPILPRMFYEVIADLSDYRDIAYERYGAALTHPGSPEERVANAIMSLEAILLNEHIELAYKLRFRVAKLLSFLGEKALVVKDTLNDGYRIRSIFAHGARLSVKDKKELESRYQSVDAFVTNLLDYARKVIVVSVLVTKSKNDVIALIDDALIDKSAEDQLQQLLCPFSNVV